MGPVIVLEETGRPGDGGGPPPVDAGRSRRSPQWQAFRQLTLVNARELVRDKVTLTFTTLFPLAFLAMFAVIPSNAPKGPTRVAVIVQPGAHTAAAIAGALDRQNGFRVTYGSPTATVATLEDGGAAVVVVATGAGAIDLAARSDSQTQLYLVREALLQATRAPGSAQVLLDGSVGTTVFDSRAFGIPAVLLLGLSSLALIGTASPMILLRQRGTLRMIGLTPCRRLTFVLAQIPARLAICLVDLTAAFVMGGIWGVTHVPDPLVLVGVLLLALALLFSVGYFAGGIIRQPELGNGLLAGIMPVALMVSGVLLPLQLLPHGLTTLARFSPLGQLGSLMRHALVGSHYTYPPLESVLVVAGTAVALTALTKLTFRWDGGEVH